MKNRYTHLPVLLVSMFFGTCLSGIAQTNGFVNELSDTKPRTDEATWKKQVTAPVIAWGSTDVRYAKYTVPEGLSKRWKATAWRGECINGQAVICSAQALKGLQATASPLKSGSYTIPASAIEVSYVGYVLTDELNKDGKGGCGHRPDKSKWDSTLVADRLETLHSLDIEACSTRPLWIKIRIPEKTKPGVYHGQITLKAEGMKSQKLPYEVHVIGRTLPSPEKWAFHLDLWQNPYSIARFYNVELWSQEFFNLARPTMKRLAEAGQKIITTTIMDMPWNGQTEDAFSSMVMKTKTLDGTWTYDYTVFDRWVEFMMSCGITKQINCYTLVPWALNFDYFDMARNKTVKIHAEPSSKEYEAYWLPFLTDFAKHLKEKGWFEKTTIAMDERPMKSMEAALAVIHKADKDFKVSGAIKYFPNIEPQIHDLCLSYGETLPDEVLKRRKEENKITTYYTCCSEAYPNTFTFSAPAEAEWIPWHALAINVDGYLRWAYNSWTSFPLQDTRFRTWAAGDCFLVYPGGSSIRFERLIEGIQDVEKARILRQEFKQKGETSKLKRLNDAIGKFIPENLHGLNATQMVKEGRKALQSLQ